MSPFVLPISSGFSKPPFYGTIQAMKDISKKFKFLSQEIVRFQALGVEAVVLFGSQAVGIARPNSDFDFGVLLKNPGVLRDYKKYSRVYGELYDILHPHIGQETDMDIVFLQKASAELLSNAARHGIVLYQDNLKTFADFKARVMEQYADFEPVRNMFHSAILSRV